MRGLSDISRRPSVVALAGSSPPRLAFGDTAIGEGRYFYQLLEWTAQSRVLTASQDDFLREKKG
jgi:hypothetical protein